MSTETLKPFGSWAQVGRTVMKGERAKFYGFNAEHDTWVALFDADQTAPALVYEAFDPIIPATEHLKRKGKAPGKTLPRVLIRQRGDQIQVWCGSNRKAIEKLKKNNYFYDGRCHRWVKDHADLAAVEKAFVYWEFAPVHEDTETNETAI